MTSFLTHPKHLQLSDVMLPPDCDNNLSVFPFYFSKIQKAEKNGRKVCAADASLWKLSPLSVHTDRERALNLHAIYFPDEAGDAANEFGTGFADWELMLSVGLR